MAGAEFRAITGAENNPADTSMGEADTALDRHSPAAFEDGIEAPSGSGRPGPREISNIVASQDALRANARGASDYLWQWGQFLDHDLSLSREREPHESLPIPVPPGDPIFDRSRSGAVELPFNRSEYDEKGDELTARQQMNSLSSYIDASNVYGSDPERARALRTLDGTGRMRVSAGDLLPFNTDGLPNAPSAEDASLFLAGDIRANEQLGLTAMHVLFVREHNRLVAQLAAADPTLDGETLYQRARAIVGAKMQVITVREFLPVLLGADALSPYTGYKPEENARLMNEFTTAAYRFGHSLVSPRLRRLGPRGQSIPAGDLSLTEAFFAPQRLIDEGGIEPLLRGLAAQPAQELDPFVVDPLRNALFGPPDNGGHDLVSLNIQRGRDHGLPDYNTMRESFGLPARATIAEISSDPEIRRRLTQAYGDVSLIDPWVGGLAEDHVPGAMLGELFFTIVRQQFERLRDGDRFWYESTALAMFSAADRAEIEATTLAQVIRVNSDIDVELPDNVFLLN